MHTHAHTPMHTHTGALSAMERTDHEAMGENGRKETTSEAMTDVQDHDGGSGEVGAGSGTGGQGQRSGQEAVGETVGDLRGTARTVSDIWMSGLEVGGRVRPAVDL